MTSLLLWQWAAQSWHCTLRNRGVGFGHSKCHWLWCLRPGCGLNLYLDGATGGSMDIIKKCSLSFCCGLLFSTFPCHVSLLLYPLSPVLWISCGLPYYWCPDSQKLCHSQLGHQSNGISPWNFSMWMLVVWADSCILLWCTHCLLWSSVHFVLQDDLLGEFETPLLK